MSNKANSIKNALVSYDWEAQITYPSASSFTGMFQNQKSAIEAAIGSNDENTENAYLLGLADEITGYFYYYRGIDIRSDFIGDPNGIIILGLFYAAKENYDQQQMSTLLLAKSKNKSVTPYFVANDAMGCFFTAIGALVGINDAKNIWNSIIAGASDQTVIAAVKLIGRRVATVITVVTTVYSVGSCLNWW